MIEAFDHPPLHAKLICRGPAFGVRMPLPADERATAPAISGGDLRFFLGAYLGALVFVLAWFS